VKQKRLSIAVLLGIFVFSTLMLSVLYSADSKEKKKEDNTVTYIDMSGFEQGIKALRNLEIDLNGLEELGNIEVKLEGLKGLEALKNLNVNLEGLEELEELKELKNLKIDIAGIENSVKCLENIDFNRIISESMKGLECLKVLEHMDFDLDYDFDFDIDIDTDNFDVDIDMNLDDFCLDKDNKHDKHSKDNKDAKKTKRKK
jgi:hypothetical protein